MMQTLTKTELLWIYKTLEHEAQSHAMLMANSPSDSEEYILANLARENIKSVMRKIRATIDDGSKRIQIK